jgi:hypothetical protein
MYLYLLTLLKFTILPTCMSPHADECSLIRADGVLIYDPCVAGGLLGSSNNIGFTLVVLETFDRLWRFQPAWVLAAPSLIITIVAELKAIFNAPLDVITVKRLG